MPLCSRRLDQPGHDLLGQLRRHHGADPVDVPVRVQLDQVERGDGVGVGTMEGAGVGSGVGGKVGFCVIVGIGVGTAVGIKLGIGVGAELGLMLEVNNPPSKRFEMVLMLD